MTFNGQNLARRVPTWSGWTSWLLSRLQQAAAVFLGESGVLSTCVHLLKRHQPGIVTILTASDAGQVFYNRRRRGEVFHLDVFHQQGEVHHRLVADFIIQAINEYCRVAGCPAGLCRRLVDLVDIQTGTGGGRVTGSLTYGRRITLKRAHRNHVHLAALLPPEHLVSLMYILAAVEQAILYTGLELRRVEGLEFEAGGTSRLSLSEYTSPSDSLMRGDGQGATGEPAAAEPVGENRSLDTGCGETGQGARTDLNIAVSTMMEHWESPEAVAELLNYLAKLPPMTEVLEAITRRCMIRPGTERMLAALGAKGLLRPQDGGYVFTPRGQRMLDYAARHSRELQAILRRSLQRKLRKETREGVGRISPGNRSPIWGKVATRRVSLPKLSGGWRDIAWPDSIVAAARRTAMASTRTATAVRARNRITIEPADLRIIPRFRYRPVDIFLLIDASASMSGERMKAAKTLARHLLSTTSDRVCVITFQERQVRVTVPLTRNGARVEKGLATIRPFGLTPMASGLAVALDYFRAVRPRNPLVILITDGIPTVPHEGKNPLDDAIKQASRWREVRTGFTCIGLQPNERYLRDLVKAAGGSLHIVDELEAKTLVSIATAERSRRVQRVDGR